MIDWERLRATLITRKRVTFSLPGFAPAAVLVPILVEPDQPERLLFTVRHADMRTHAGQISFPGGRCDATDLDSAATAVREAAEELAIAPAAIDILGELDDVPVPTQFMITPVVAKVSGPFAFSPSPHEVAAIFSAPLDGLRYQFAGERTFMGVSYELHEYYFGEHRIWGATARMVFQLLEALR